MVISGCRCLVLWVKLKLWLEVSWLLLLGISVVCVGWVCLYSGSRFG